MKVRLVMNERSQVLAITLWILAVLTITVISIAYQASLGLKLSQYNWNKLRTYALAKAGVNSAINILQKDSNIYDSLDDVWTNNNDLALIKIKDNDGYATVSYLGKSDKTFVPYYGIIDEERKININKAPLELLKMFFKNAGIFHHSDLAEAIWSWRGNEALKVSDHSEQGSIKNGYLTVPEELLLFEDMDNEAFDMVKDMVTVWGDGKVNLNTASESVLEVLVEYSKSIITNGENNPEDLISRIIRVRPVGSFNELIAGLQEQRGLSSGQLNILGIMENYIDFHSKFFRIYSEGKIYEGKISTTVDCVFDRSEKRMVYWHEN